MIHAAFEVSFDQASGCCENSSEKLACKARKSTFNEGDTKDRGQRIWLIILVKRSPLNFVRSKFVGKNSEKNWWLEKLKIRLSNITVAPGRFESSLLNFLSNQKEESKGEESYEWSLVLQRRQRRKCAGRSIDFLSINQVKFKRGGKSGHVHVASNRRVLFTVRPLVLDSKSGAWGESVQCLSALDSWPIRLVFVLEIEPAGRASHRALQSRMDHEHGLLLPH